MKSDNQTSNPPTAPKVALKFEKRDAWIGVYWNRSPLFMFEGGSMYIEADLTEVYVCLVPFLPLKISWIKRRKLPVFVRAVSDVG